MTESAEKIRLILEIMENGESAVTQEEDSTAENRNCPPPKPKM